MPSRWGRRRRSEFRAKLVWAAFFVCDSLASRLLNQNMKGRTGGRRGGKREKGEIIAEMPQIDWQWNIYNWNFCAFFFCVNLLHCSGFWHRKSGGGRRETFMKYSTWCATANWISLRQSELLSRGGRTRKKKSEPRNEFNCREARAPPIISDSQVRVESEWPTCDDNQSSSWISANFSVMNSRHQTQSSL